jgi:UDPglucose 6-dehydrogenase
MKIGIVGLGYVGLVTGVNFARLGQKVYGFDVDVKKQTMIMNCVPPFKEPKLEEYMKSVIPSGQFELVDSLAELESVSDLIYVCVGTPSDEHGNINLKYIENVMTTLKGTKKIVIIKSTVVPGTTRRMSHLYDIQKIGMIPEFLAEGNAFNDIEKPNKIVIGCDNSSVMRKLRAFYRNIYSTQIIDTNTVNAEMIKYAQNTMLATKITMMNGFANIIQELEGGDIKVVEKALGLDSRICDKFLRAGAGYGGSCFSKDIAALCYHTRNDLFRDMLVNINELNNRLREYIGEDVVYRADEIDKISILGLSFKPGTDDMRDAPSIDIIDYLCTYTEAVPENIYVYDPIASSNAKKVIPQKVNYTHSIEECLDNSNIVLILTEWEEIKNISPGTFKTYMKTPIVYDARRIYDPETFKREGIHYYGVGYNNDNS